MPGDQKPLVYKVYQFIWNITDLIYPPYCAGCGASGFRWCPNCQGKTHRISVGHCEKCGIPLQNTAICQLCVKSVPTYDQTRSWSTLSGPLQKAIHKLKYHKDYGLADIYTSHLSNMVNDLKWEPDVIVPVPLGKKRHRERGYNQAAAIARPLAWSLNIPYLPRALERIKETLSQVGLSRHERKSNVKNAFQATRSMVSGKRVLLVDDVMTTGATLNACSIALKHANASKVYGLTLTRAISARSQYNYIDMEILKCH